MMQADRRETYQQMRERLNEKQWRHYLALEAKERGSVMRVAQEAGVSHNTVRRGLREVESGERSIAGQRQRKQGGGRKKISEKDPTLLSDLEGLLEPKDDPMSLLRWTCKSITTLKGALQEMGHTIADTALRDVLHSRGYSLRANKKTIEDNTYADLDAQFTHIKRLCEQFDASGDPIISVDCKKKELLGTFKNNGWEWQAKGAETIVNVRDFLALADGSTIPHKIYNPVHKQGFVNVGIDRDTAEFAVESIKRWWRQSGKALYPDRSNLLITADEGGSNGARNRLWKKKLQGFANDEHLTITVAHYPPATSKWNKIEHRLFSFITLNWQAQSLTLLEVAIELISHTTTNQGLTIKAVKDNQTYPTGLNVTDEDLALLNLFKDSFHGEWNYTLKPQKD